MDGWMEMKPSRTREEGPSNALSHSTRLIKYAFRDHMAAMRNFKLYIISVNRRNTVK
jgi:hypothetical protein